jgi:hypothetical protein
VRLPEHLLRKIESAGYRVSGARDALGEGQDGPLTVIAQNEATGEKYTVTVTEQGAEGETKALQQLVEKIGLSAGRGQ